MTTNNVNSNGNTNKVIGWKEFCDRKENDTGLDNIFKAFNVADENTNEKTISNARKLVEELDKGKYDEEIENFNYRIKVLEKRLERKVSSSFGSTVKHLREQKGLSLAKLGEIAGVSASYINRIEIGQRNAPSIPIIESLANSLGVEVAYLLNVAGIEDDNKPATISKLVYSNNVTLKDGEGALNGEEKTQFLEIIEFIINATWKENKHLEMVELIKLLDEFKAK